MPNPIYVSEIFRVNLGLSFAAGLSSWIGSM